MKEQKLKTGTSIDLSREIVGINLFLYKRSMRIFLVKEMKAKEIRFEY